MSSVEWDLNPDEPPKIRRETRDEVVERRTHTPPDDGGRKPVAPPPKPSDARSAAQPCDDSLAGETTRGDKALQPSRFRTVVADPPWPYENESWGVGAVGDEYATMTYEDICALPVTEWVERDAHLYLWVTNAKLLDYDYAQLINAWGFSYKTCLTWHKTACLGIGHYFRGETEHILFCTRGRAPIAPEHRERNLFQSPRGRHSAKPDALYDLVERVSPGPYLDMFSRRARLGWHTWGAESLHGTEAVV